jgi:hypothetical protein
MSPGCALTTAVSRLFWICRAQTCLEPVGAGACPGEAWIQDWPSRALTLIQLWHTAVTSALADENDTSAEWPYR